MRLEQLLYFKKTAETGSIRQAAELLFVSPQGISKAILQLEQELQTPLFLRSRAGVKLTSEGDAAYTFIQQIFKDIDALNEHFHITGSTLSDESKHPVAISCCSVMEALGSGTVNYLINSQPETAVQIDQKGSKEIITLLCSSLPLEEKPDLALANETDINMDQLKKKAKNDYQCYFLFSDVLCLQVPVGDPLENYDKIPLSILKDLPMLLYSNTPRQKTVSEQILADKGFALTNVSRISNIDTCSRLALNQHRYCFVGYPSVEFRPMANVVYIPLEEPISTNQMLFVKRNRKNRTFTNAFVKSLDDMYNLQLMW